MQQFYVYILASKRNGTLYIGVTSDLRKRIYEHKNNLVDGFSKEYSVHKLVYFEIYEDVSVAILREKKLKKWKREWKLKLIEEKNPTWEDLYQQLSDWIPAFAGMTHTLESLLKTTNFLQSKKLVVFSSVSDEDIMRM